MDVTERFVWQLKSEHYDRLERKYDKEHDGLTAVLIAIWPPSARITVLSLGGTPQ
jgi:hypothetical protein